MLDTTAFQPSGALELDLKVPQAFEGLFVKARYKGFWGGRGGAKSHTFATVLLLMALQRRLRILCCREIQNSIADSVKQLLEDKIEEMGLGWFFRATQKDIRGLNGSRFSFEGLLRNVSKIKSKEAIDIVWVEEANTASDDSLEKLIPTIRKPGSELWFSWNPEDPSDPIDKLLRGEEPLEPDPELMRDYETWQIVRHVGFRDNPWFPAVLRAEMETMRRRDPDKYAHIWLGQYLKMSEARVFRNWRVGTAEEVEAAERRAARFYFGGDWGFSVDPSVLVKMSVQGRTLYIHREAHAVGCDVDFLPFLFGGFQDDELNAMNGQALALAKRQPWAQQGRWPGIPGARRWPIIADSARPETISYMRRHGFGRMESSIKGAGSVEDGIEFLKAYDIVIHPDCLNCIDEMTLYSWKVDKKTREVLPVLEDKKNNVIDAIRYGAEKARRAGGFSGTVRGTH